MYKQYDGVENVDFVIPPSGVIARCIQTKELINIIEGIPVYRTVTGDVIGLPASKENTFFLTSAMVASALKGRRDDVLVPNDFIRDTKGTIIGCQSLSRF